MKMGVLDVEWVKLIKEAKELGLSVEEVRLFFENYKNKE
ncbi:anti-repressor SinI family protein [Pullulanibacillus sp. KACC 23026]|nr:anti-repressor SinI family protein [Pullulanibacillus sp. KACC 23026]WEG11527.1 anti-repressor SinI family protein [Pullulanibacillus sp. KACC 23026]